MKKRLKTVVISAFFDCKKIGLHLRFLGNNALIDDA